MEKTYCKYSVIVNVNLEYIVIAKSYQHALEIVENTELPEQYVSGSYELVKTGIVDKNGETKYL